MDHKIALYYCYKPIAEDLLESYQSDQISTCSRLSLNGRIRLSPEGVNGVLSGLMDNLKQYEHELTLLLFPKTLDHDDPDALHNTATPLRYGQTLDVKYCSLRTDIPIDSQLFDSLQVSITKHVVTLVDPPIQQRTRRGKLGWDNVPNIRWDQYAPSPHLAPQEWNQQLLLSSSSSSTHDPDTRPQHDDYDAILVDARNVYESSIGHFKVPGIPTLLTNTRKYSDLTDILAASMERFSGKNVFLYCTGGVRCERVSSYLQALVESDQWPQDLMKPKNIYQLQGGIQKYLEMYGTIPKAPQNGDQDCMASALNWDNRHELDKGPCLYAGKNFVFDPRRTDPVVGPCSVVGRCILCQQLHDDYDNGHAPCDNKEARCCNCRILVLVCSRCRNNVRVWGEDEDNNKPSIFCGKKGNICAGLGNKVDNVTLL